MQLADDDLVKFKTLLYYPIEELLYNYMYRLNIKRAANVYDDDSQIDMLSITRSDPKKGGAAVVSISEYGT